jgi:hypothetical protein
MLASALAQGAILSVVHDVKLDARLTLIARACPSVRQDSPAFSLFSSVITSCLLASRKRVRRDKRGGTPKALGRSPF